MPRRFQSRLRAFLFALLFSVVALAQQPAPFPPPPQMTLPLMLRKLHTTARILHITAHPDDEDGAMLAYESWGKGATVMLLTLNRGEGGQNATGPELFDELGILRTLELLEADKYYGVEQRFTRVADFGFSKSAAQTFQKWGGHDVPLADVVRVIREFQPDVIVSRFQGLPRDGHGHHQAAGILAREAFRAAADPTRFPEQINEGLLPWQPKKLYVGNIHPDEESTIKIETSQVDPLLGKSYAELAMEGLHHQRSQGGDHWNLPPGPRFSRYKLVDTVLPNYHPQHEQDFMDGIDDSVEGLIAEEKKLGLVDEKNPAEPLNASHLREMQVELSRLPATSPAEDVATLANAVKTLGSGSSVDELSPAPFWKDAAIINTGIKVFEIVRHLKEAMNIAEKLDFRTELKINAETSPVLFHGKLFTLKNSITNSGSEEITAVAIENHFGAEPRGIRLPKPSIDRVPPRDTRSIQVNLKVPGNLPYSRTYFHRDDPERDALLTIDESWWATLPLPPPAVTGEAFYNVDGVPNPISAGAVGELKQPDGTTLSAPLLIAPRFSLWIEPSTQLARTDSLAPLAVTTAVTSNVDHAGGILRLQLPAGWRSQPASQELTFARAGETQNVSFAISPSGQSEQLQTIHAVFDSQNEKYEEGYKLIGRPDISYYPYYRPASQRISLVDVRIPPMQTIGYIMGAGDQIPDALREIGYDVHTITPQELAGGDLSHYSAIITGIRAYDERADLRQYNPRLLDFVSRGGALMVLYNSNIAQFNSGNFAPYPLTLSHDRVTDENSEITFLDPQNPVLLAPNKITSHDFSGWIQERGIYFADSWDPHFHPLFACHDVGEQPLAGGLLIASYGKGTYIYNGYSFFRQLPYGVPGAVRLFVNLLSARSAAAAGAGATDSDPNRPGEPAAQR